MQKVSTRVRSHLTQPKGRSYLLIRSIAFSALTKAFGFLVIFACLPLAALSLTADEYAAFNYSMAATTTFAIVFTPVGTTFVVRFAHASNDRIELRRLAQNSLAIFMTLGLALELPAILFAYWLSPAEFRLSIAVCAAAFVATATLSWAEVFRLGVRQDHISSAFGLASNATIILIFGLLHQYEGLTFARVLTVYYFCPLCWALVSFLQVLFSTGIRFRLQTDYDEWKRTIWHARPNVVNSVSDYIKLYGASFVAFYLSGAQAYGAFSTVQLLIARLSNPLSLIARPLIPAYVDAIARGDLRWVRWLKRASSILCLVAFLAVLLVVLVTAVKPPGDVRVGVVALHGPESTWYSVSGFLLFASTSSLTLLASVYLAERRMGVFSRTCLVANVASVLVGGFATAWIGPIAMLASIAAGSAIASIYLTWRFATFPSSKLSAR
ncbi:hypothetical protein [Bradyrhizobium sp. WYCCWR 12699]|uniref:hypothetical protein n=1 Tax=Bradyrhizobium sp. WYCCWR 12699 TaxID=3064203 RepID=UPI0028A32430|nr:hypothetical protein [Bradyrhizobium sp. WYCCWR 12699]MDT4743658.1 hypothetical protein [Bradyrhizobium sp. WYCCWR 12699]